MIVRDNGTEPSSMANLKWTQDSGIEWHYIAPGKPFSRALNAGEAARIGLRPGDRVIR